MSHVLVACAPADRDRAANTASQVQSVYTGLGADECRREVDTTDPNETPFWVCPGVAGYTLVVRQVDAGRRSIDVVDSAQRATPLNFHEVVTRSMSSLAKRAEWRVASEGGRQVPIALIVRVEAREDNENPERITHSFVAVAKITPGEVCVTDRIADGMQADSAARVAADSAAARACAPPQPPMTVDGTVVR